MRSEIRNEIGSIRPLDSLEERTLVDVINWIDSGAELCRLRKPDFPNKHLVSYFVVVDDDYLLLVDHINAERWLPTGGHVEPGEHPRTTVLRECFEELNLVAEFLVDEPILVTSTETVGKTSGHTDISIWYALRGNRRLPVEYAANEFNGAQWFHTSNLPKRTDPHLGRFVEKLFANSIR